MEQVKPRSAKRGLAAVETAILLPLVVLVVMAVFEYGWLILKSGQLAAGAREGARYGARDAATAVEAETQARAALNQMGISNTCIVSIVCTMGTTPGAPVTVECTYDYAGCALTHFPLLPIPSQLVRRHTFAKE